MHELLLAESWQVPHIPIGDWFNAIVTWLQNNVGPLLDFINLVVTTCIDVVTWVLSYLPGWAMMIIFALLGLWIRGWKFGLAALIGFALIDSMDQFDNAMQTLALVLVAGIIAIIIAIPLGISAARNGRVSRIVKPVMDFMQTLPQFVYLIPVVLLFSTGVVPGVLATIVFALPPGVRLTELGIRQVDKEMVEAGEAFGAPGSRILRGIQIPLAMPSIMAGINQVIMLTLSMVVISGMLGAPGLGKVVYAAVTQVQVASGFEAGIGVVVLAIFLDRLTASLGDRSAVARAQKAAAKV